MRTTCVDARAAGGLFLLAFGQPPSEGRWCWCPFQMGFKSSSISCQLPTYISKTGDRRYLGGPPYLSFHDTCFSAPPRFSALSLSVPAPLHPHQFTPFTLISLVSLSSLLNCTHSAPYIVLSSSITYTSNLFLGVFLHRFDSDLTHVCA